MELNQVLSQRTRLTQVPRPDQISVDHRSLAQLLGLASEYGQFFHFYNLDNSIDGDWEPMFSSDPAIAFSLQLSVDLKLVEARMFSMIDDLIITAPRALNLQVMTSLHGLVARMLTILSGRPCSAANAAQLYRSAAALAALTTAAMPLASFFELLPPEKLTNPDLVLHSGNQLDRLIELLRDFCGLLLDALDAVQAQAQQGLTHELQQSGHAPHVALYVAFVRMYQKVQRRLNQFPAELLDFYHQTVLRQAEFSQRLPRPDRVVLTFRLQPDVPSAPIPLQAEFIAGNDADGNPILYRPDVPIDANNTSLTRLQSLRLFTLKPPTGSADQPSNRLLTHVLVKEVNLPLVDPPAPFRQPLFPLRKTPPSAMLPSLPPELGFGCASPLFELRGGDRTVIVDLDLSLPSPCPAPLASVNPIGVPALLASLMQKYLSCRITDGAALRDVAFKVEPAAADPKLGDGIVRLSLQLNLDASAPAWTSSPSLHPLPMLLCRLLPEAMALSPSPKGADMATPYTWLSLLELHGLNVSVCVQNDSGLPMDTPLGRADPTAPFLVFGAPACRGASFTLVTEEIIHKPVDSLSLKIDWHNLPVNLGGFSDYYKAYVIDVDGQRYPPGSLFSNSSFQVDLQVITTPETRPQSPIAADRQPLFASSQSLEPSSALSSSALQGLVGICGLRVTLVEPTQGFGDFLYQANIMEASIGLSALYRGVTDSLASSPTSDPGSSAAALLWPNPPWQAQATAVSLSYQSSAQLTRDTDASGKVWIEFLHLGPFSALQPVCWPVGAPLHLLPAPLEAALEPTVAALPATTLPEQEGDLPQRRDADACLILDWSEPITEAHWLIGLATAITMPPQPRPLWIDVWREGGWQPLPATAYQDGSSGLTTAGILRLQIPAGQAASRLRLSTMLGEHPSPDLVCLEPNAAWVSWHGPAGSDRLDHCLPAGTISASRSALAGIASIRQPLPSLGGMPADGEAIQQIRFTERLAHKGMAIQPDDYAKILLDQFPTLWQVAVLPATNADGEPCPGSVALVPVPGPKAATVADPTIPVCDASFGLRIAQVLRSRISPFVKLAIVEPVYCRITVHAQVIFTTTFSAAVALQQLQQDLVLFLSPWPSEDALFSRPESYYDELCIGHFIRERPYVYAIETLRLSYSPDRETLAKSPFLYYTSALQHQLSACLPKLAMT